MKRIKAFFGGLWTKIKESLKTAFTEEYQVVIWYDAEKKTVYSFKKIIKLTDTEISAVKTTGEKFDMKVKEPFNYQVTKVY